MVPVLTAAVFSDTHGNTARMLEAVRASKPDAIIHLGDYDRDTQILEEEFPEIPLYRVCGNCDVSPMAPDSLVAQLGPVKAFLTHGHQYDVDWGRLDYLVYAAQEAECSLAMFGHTHRADLQEMGGVTLLNPGTAGRGRDLSWAWVEVFENGGIACQIRDL